METEPDLAQALTAFGPGSGQSAGAGEPGDDPVAELRAALDRVLTRAATTAVRLEEEDSVARSRQAYVAAILRLLDYMLMEPQSADQMFKQASVALGYVRHIETSRLAALQIGRSARDEKLTTAVQRLRAEMVALSEKRAKVDVESRERKRLAVTTKGRG